MNMSLDPIQQFESLLARSHDVVMFIPENAGGDAIGSAWAMYFFLKKKGINSTIVFPDGEGTLERFSFLEKPGHIDQALSGARDFVLAFDTSRSKIIDVRTERDENAVRIFITPEHGAIDPRDFSFIPARFKYDLAIVIDSPDKESIGQAYAQNPDIFYEVPVVNIDRHSGNDNFGQVNIVDITASATAEIVADLFEKTDAALMDETIAQCLLAGIIDATNSFQKKNTTPKSLQAAAALMTKGADQQKIIRFLYKTQPFHLLKVWGRIMARLNWENDLLLIWAPVLIEDFVQSRSSAADIPSILEKIKENYSTGKIVMVLYDETPQMVKGVIKCTDSEQLKRIATILGGTAIGDICQFSQPSEDLREAGKKVVEKIRILQQPSASGTDGE